jgi:hypothetical protein
MSCAHVVLVELVVMHEGVACLVRDKCAVDSRTSGLFKIHN